MKNNVIESPVAKDCYKDVNQGGLDLNWEETQLRLEVKGNKSLEKR